MKSQFLKFTLLTQKEGHLNGLEQETIIINKDHLVSLKPIKIMDNNNNVFDGFWIRTANGKKYKAIEIPQELRDLFNQTEQESISVNSDEDEEVFVQ